MKCLSVFDIYAPYAREFAVAVSERCKLGDQTTKQDEDAVNRGVKKRPSCNVQRHPNKCLRDISASDDAPAADDNDDNWTASGDVMCPPVAIFIFYLATLTTSDRKLPAIYTGTSSTSARLVKNTK